MRPLIISDETRALTKVVIDYAVQPAHWYRVNTTQEIEGPIQPANICIVPLDIVCVFMIVQEADGDKIYRHLQAGVPGGRYVSSYLMCALAAELFGFTGWKGGHDSPPDSWNRWSIEVPPMLLISQELTAEELRAFTAS